MFYISHQRARSFGAHAYRMAKRGSKMIVTHAGGTWYLCHVIPHGFYLEPYAVPQRVAA